MKIYLLIPIYNPPKIFQNLLRNINNLKFIYKIIVVNDGSSKIIANSIFREFQNNSKIKILKHEKNLGKGEALKTGFRYIQKLSSQKDFVFCIDGDGQHSISDLIKIYDFLINNQNYKIIFGVRNFSFSKTPFRSFLGNKITYLFFYYIYKYKILDTQTGFRVLSSSLLNGLSNLKGSRYEYESIMLKYFVDNKIDIKQFEISTIYLNNNESSNFNPLKDSYIIYGNLFEYYFIFLIYYLMDTSFFAILFSLSNNSLFSNFISSIISFFVSTILIYKLYLNTLINKFIFFIFVNLILISILFIKYDYSYFNILIKILFGAIFIYISTNFFKSKKKN